MSCKIGFCPKPLYLIFFSVSVIQHQQYCAGKRQMGHNRLDGYCRFTADKKSSCSHVQEQPFLSQANNPSLRSSRNNEMRDIKLLWKPMTLTPPLLPTSPFTIDVIRGYKLFYGISNVRQIPLFIRSTLPPYYIYI